MFNIKFIVVVIPHNKNIDDKKKNFKLNKNQFVDYDVMTYDYFIVLDLMKINCLY